MKTPTMRFETVPLEEVIHDKARKPMQANVEKLVKKEGPYSVNDIRRHSRHAHPHHRNSPQQAGS